MIDFTPEQMAAKSYAAAMDSVNLINAGKPAGMAEADWADCLSRNKEHLKIQVAKTEYYAGFDMTAIAAAAT